LLNSTTFNYLQTDKLCAMKKTIITFFSVLVILLISLNGIKAQDRRFSLFVKIKDATIVREIDRKHTWYIWKNALLNETIPGQAQGHMWCTLLTDDQPIIKMDSATWELFVKVTMLGDDGEKINISYHSFDVPNVMTESKKFGWMNNASCEAGGSFYRDGYMFDMKFFEQPQDFRFRRIPATAF